MPLCIKPTCLPTTHNDDNMEPRDLHHSSKVGEGKEGERVRGRRKGEGGRESGLGKGERHRERRRGLGEGGGLREEGRVRGQEEAVHSRHCDIEGHTPLEAQ